MAAKAFEKLLKCGNNRLEIFLSEIGPLVIVNSLIYGPPLHIRCIGGSGERCLTLRYSFLFSFVSP